MIDETLLRYVMAFLVLVIGLVFLFGLYRFGISLFQLRSASALEDIREVLLHMAPDARRYQWMVDSFSGWHQSYLEKRNDFWEHYGQVALAVLIVVVLAVLLLTRAISAEAGLPILSAVAGFAIAKTNSSTSSVRRPEPPARNE